MGFGRFLAKNMIPGYRIVSTGKKIIEHGIVDGIKSEVKETVKDNPVTGAIFNMGHEDGKVDGYVDASSEYEQKFLKQADKFLEQKRILQNDIEEYEELLKAYEEEIEVLQRKNSLSSEENLFLQKLLLKERELLKLR